MINDIVTLEEHSDTIAILNMQDLVNKNTFTDEFVTKMVEKLRMIHSNTNYKAVIIKGLPEIFSAGASKDALRELAGGKAQVKDFILSELLVEIPVPVIAAMEGGAVGGGLVIGLCCDIVIMNQRCLYGGGFLNLGFTPGMGYTRLLQGLVGEYFAGEMMYTGDLYKGRVFREKGLVNYILPKNEIWPKAVDLAEIIAEKPRGTLVTLKYSIGLKKRQLLAEARVHEDFMHTITFNQPETQKLIETNYPVITTKAGDARNPISE